MIFGRDGDLFVPTGHARGPWDPGMMHGGAPSALLTRAIEALAPEMQLARLTVDFLGAVPLAPVRVEAEIWRRGRRMQLARATLTLEDGREFCRAGAVLLARQELEGLPDDTLGPPLAVPPEDGTFDDWQGEGDAFYRTGMEMRWIPPGSWDVGPSAVWFRLAHPVVEGEEPSPAMRAAAAADFGNGVSRVLSFDGSWLFVNTDLTVTLHRPPRGEWVAIDARTIVQPGGVGLAASTLHDREGPIGTGQQTLYVGRP
jgi:acyl-coenzyme A thioesterase PaaI-like protein